MLFRSGREDVEEDKPDEGKDEDVLTVLEVIWPKKEGLTLVKWCVLPLVLVDRSS